ncbi:hypothetical protein ACJJTC_011757 [Scirpophaga incertulas]
MLGRRLRGRLDLLRPDAAERVRDRQLVEEQRRNTPLRVVSQHEPVLIRNYNKTGNKWTEALVEERIGPVTYSVKTKDGRIQKRHIDQIITPKKSRHSLSQVVEESKGQGRSDIDTPKEGSGEDQAFDSVEEVVDDGTEPSAKSPEDTAHIINTRPSSRAAALRCREKLAKI